MSASDQMFSGGDNFPAPGHCFNGNVNITDTCRELSRKLEVFSLYHFYGLWYFPKKKTTCHNFNTLTLKGFSKDAIQKEPTQYTGSVCGCITSIATIQLMAEMKFSAI